MKSAEVIEKALRPPRLTRERIALALLVAVFTDAVQILLGPLGWTFADEILDVIAMVVVSAAIGFHPLLLPTFVLEVIPIVDWLPTWTACITAVVVLRKKQQAQAPIDVESTVSCAPPDPLPTEKEAPRHNA